MRLVIAFALAGFIVSGAGATELWSCHVTTQSVNEPILLSLEVTGRRLIQTWASGIKHRYEIVRDNRYGLVAFSSISEIEAGQTGPTVGVSAVVISRTSREIWLSTVVAGQPREANEPAHGECVLKH
jgi:hypothetical protein